jgi:predicted PurR-regulated permease PerM
MARLRAGSERLAGGIGDDLVTAVRNTVTGVAYGLIGTAIAQGVVATIGFLIAGVPAAFLLGAATFVLSLIPLGPVLIWGGAAVWLYQQDEIGWTIFMVLYGLLVISSVDNFIKPLLISRTSSMSLFMVVLGVFGGVLAFGFMGIFIGPIFLVLTDSLARRWLDRYTAQQGS